MCGRFGAVQTPERADGKCTLEARQKLQADAQITLAALRGEIVDAVDKIAHRKGAAFAVEKGSLLYGIPTLDVTDEITDYINRGESPKNVAFVRLFVAHWLHAVTLVSGPRPIHFWWHVCKLNTKRVC